MDLPGRAVRRPVATVTILCVILVIGIVSLTQTPLDLLPEIRPPFLAVITVFPGSSPQENLKLVTEPIEDSLSTVGGLTNMQSLSQENVSLVLLEFNWGADLTRLRDEVGARLDLLALPEGVRRPIIVEFDPTLLPIMQVAVSGGGDRVELTRWLEEHAVPKLEKLPGVASVQVLGGARRDLFIRLDPEKMREHRLSFEQVANVLRASLLDLPAGIVELDNKRMRVRFLGRPPAIADLSRMVIGFEVDEGELERMVGRSVSVDLNRMLSGTLPEPGEIEIPTRDILVKDVAGNFTVDEEAGLLIITPDPAMLEQLGLEAEQLAALLPEELEARAEEGRILIPLPEDRTVDWEALRETVLLTVPDFQEWSRQMQAQLGMELDRASRQIEEMLVDLAMAMVLSSAGPGAGLGVLEDDFPLIPVTLGSVAEISEDLYPADTVTRFNGNPSIGLALQKEGRANTVAVSRQVRQALEDLAAEFAAQGFPVTFNYSFDQAREIEIALADLARALLLGSILAIAVLLLFLRNWRTILIIGLTIPVAVIAAFALLYFARLTINLMTLGALALAAGMLVDNAIVVSENIYRHLQLGASPNDAAVRGTQEVAGAITASTLTTLSVFFPVVFLSGLAGEIFREFALTVGCALLASLLMALTVIPLLAALFLNGGMRHNETAPRLPRYRALLQKALRHPWAVVGCAAATLVMGILFLPGLGTALFPVPEETSFSVNVKLPPGTPLSETDEFMSRLEEVVAEQRGVESFTTRVGESRTFGIATEAGATNQGQIRIQVEPGQAGRIDEMVAAVRRRAEALEGDAQILIRRESLLEATGLDVQIEILIQGPELDTIKALSAEAVERLQELPFLTDISAALDDDRPEIHIQVDHFEALRKGVTVYQVATMLNQALEGMAVSRLETAEGILNLVLGYREEGIATLEDLKNIGFYTASGSYLRLGDVAEFTESLGPLNIPRENRQVVGRIQAQFQGIDLGTATRETLAALEELELPPGYSLREASSGLMAEIYDELYLVLAVAAALVYLVMAAQFESFVNPFIIICSLPLAFSGAVLALFITGNSLSIPALIGAVVLSGILVNDGIIMVDFINQQRHIHGLPLLDAIVEGASARLRPIIMTTITTVLGLVPLALGLGEGSQLQAPMAIVIIGGMLSGTLLLLVVIPSVYLLINCRGG